MNRERALVVAVVAVLAGLNLYQYAARSGAQPPPQALDGTAADAAAEARFRDRLAEMAYTRTPWGLNLWSGINTVQNPWDVWIIQEIIFEVKPDFIVETGTYRGGSAAMWATILEQANPGGRVITVDIADLSARARRLPIAKRSVEFLVGSSTDVRILGRIRQRVAGKKVLVILDSSHLKSHVLRELELYAPMVDVGSYLIVQDSNPKGYPVLQSVPPGGEGPMEAIEAFLAENPGFVADRSRERFLFTMQPQGYLKRVR